MQKQNLQLGPIKPHVLYPIEVLKARSGFGVGAMREARRAGMKVKYAGGRAFIKGEWFIAYIEEHGRDRK